MATQDRPPAALSEPARALVLALRALRTGSASETDGVGAMLADRSWTDPAVARQILAVLAPEPELVLRLAHAARNFDGATYRAASRYFDGGCDAARGEAPDWRARAEARLNQGPLSVALASLAADGRVREAAVSAMAATPDPELLPFLVLRTTDWVPQVRDRAFHALTRALYQHPVDVRLAGPMAVRLAARARSGFAIGQVTVALGRLAPDELADVLAGGCAPLRRLAARQADRLPLASLVRLALRESDPAARDLLAVAAAREAMWTGRLEFLQQLAEARSPDVRAIALTGLLRTGRPQEAVCHLADPHPLVRATARFVARKADVDVLAACRALALAVPADPYALLALAEETANGNAPGSRSATAHLLEVRLSRGEPRVRAAALTALRLLGVDVFDRAAVLLADLTPPVVRAAALALEADASRLDPAMLLALLDAPAAAVGPRRAVYRVCRRHRVPIRLAAALTVVAAGDPRLAERAIRDLRALMPPGRSSRAAAWLGFNLAEAGSAPDLPARLTAATPYLDPDMAAVLGRVVEATTVPRS
jgi:hypothetical protein